MGTPGTVDDTQLFLFGAGGLGVAANDDAAGGGLRSRIPSGFPTGSGVSYLAITSFNDDPTSNSPASAAGLIFPSTPFTGVFGPTGPGGALPLADWTAQTGATGTYTIVLTGAVFCAANAVCLAPPPAPAGAIFGTAGADLIYGTAGPDVIYAGGGNDRVAGLGGDDLIFGEAGDDQLTGGDGNDILCGGSGNDSLVGSFGDDVLSGDSGLDSLSGGDGNDTLIGGTEADRLTAGAGVDVCRTGGDAGDLADTDTCETATA